MRPNTSSQKPEVLIIGGGFAGLEATLALSDLAPGLAEVTLINPGSDFVYKPLTVEEPFTGRQAPHFELAPIIKASGASRIEGTLERVDPYAKTVTLVGGNEFAYEALIVCVGARPHPAYEGVETFWTGFDRLAVDELIDKAFRSPGHALNLIVPPRTTWSLPLYELALMLRLRADARGNRDAMRIRIITPEQRPLLIFGDEASTAVAGLLDASRIEIELASEVVDDGGIPAEVPLGRPLPTVGPVISLPVLEGPAIPGLPADPRGFIAIGAGCEVPGCPGVYAAGDGTTFPLKQGGLATQQADAAAERVAADLGSTVKPEPFKPILRGRLLTGGDPLDLGKARLWWPEDKVHGRYLSAALHGAGAIPEPPRASRPIEVEVSWPHEWHGTPMLPYVGAGTE